MIWIDLINCLKCENMFFFNWFLHQFVSMERLISPFAAKKYMLKNGMAEPPHFIFYKGIVKLLIRMLSNLCILIALG